jgi:hypothetical protein
MAAGFIVGALLAQAVLPSADSLDPERIRKALEHQPAITTEASTDDSGRPLFRMSVRVLRPEPIWDNWTNVPSYIRPYHRGYHHEFLEMVTPEAFRSATLFPVGIPVIPLLELLSKHNRAVQRKTQEAQAREEVRQAIAELLACRANPSRPGC